MSFLCSFEELQATALKKSESRDVLVCLDSSVSRYFFLPLSVHPKLCYYLILCLLVWSVTYWQLFLTWCQACGHCDIYFLRDLFIQGLWYVSEDWGCQMPDQNGEKAGSLPAFR